MNLFGVRHHGPGCARAAVAALEAFGPDAVVVEGPADAQEALAFVGHDDLKPPVALVVYPPETPQRAVYYPLAEFSPEWQALRWAAARTIPTTLMDLPQAIQLAMELEKSTKNERPDEEERISEEHDESDEDAEESAPPWRVDPLAVLAEAAGYTDHELWWEEQIERRRDAGSVFEAIVEAMTAVRQEFPEARPRDLLREAHMRQTIRSVQKSGAKKIAVICGAWHVPALHADALAGKVEGCTPAADVSALKPLPKLATTATWIPWTHSRLAFASGYGAGVQSPGWYAHVWKAPDHAPLRWLSSAARLLRTADLDASSASVIEAARLADALAALRELRTPGLAELNEATLAVLCHGQTAPMRLIRRKLEVGEALGEVPEDAPAVPLARDLEKTIKTLRLKKSAESKVEDFDLRKPNDLARSQLLHRLALLGVPWGVLQHSGGRTSTFHEIWRMEWKPEYAVALVEANVWGSTVEAAAAAKIVHDGSNPATELPALAALLDGAVIAGLPTAVPPLLTAVEDRAAASADVQRLMQALPALVRVSRYGDVRQTSAEQVKPIALKMFERILVGLPSAASGLDDDAAEALREGMAVVHEVVPLLADDERRQEWIATLRALMDGEFHGLLRGWCCRCLLADRAIDEDALDSAARLALSLGNDPAASAAWLAGLLKGSGLLLLHLDGLWTILDRWLAELAEDTFVKLLPILRRAFADFTGPERRQMGEKVKHLDAAARPRQKSAQNVDDDVDWERARLAFPVLKAILGEDDAS